MTTAWTGGQYSVLRVLLALGAMRVVFGSDAPALLNLLALVPVACLAVGWRDRIASIVLAVWTVWLSWSMSAALLLHAALPQAPYGSWEARGRSDPAGDWEMPDWAPLAAWGLIGLVHAYWGVSRVVSLGPALLVGLIELGLLVAAAVAADYRRWAWLALTLLAVANNDPVGVLLLHAFAFDPTWIPASSRVAPATLFYDGTCGLCHRAVRFMLSEDRHARFQLAPLQSAAFTRLVPAESREGLPDSLVLQTRDGQLLVRWSAAVEVATALGGLWRALATVAMLLPPELGDRLYDFVAARRRRLFAAPDALCPIVPPRLRERFLPDGLPADDQPSEPSAAR